VGFHPSKPKGKKYLKTSVWNGDPYCMDVHDFQEVFESGESQEVCQKHQTLSVERSVSMISIFLFSIFSGYQIDKTSC
jgi:hypothetical protein